MRAVAGPQGAPLHTLDETHENDPAALALSQRDAVALGGFDTHGFNLLS
jgi:hypothetical protein